MNEFKDRLKLLRTLLGLSQAEMARKLGIARSRISELEAGKTKPRDSILRLISHTFGVSYRWLKEGEGEMWERIPAEIQISIIKDIIRELKKIEKEYNIDIPPDLFAKAVETIYEEVTEEFANEEERKKLIKRSIGKIIKLSES